MDVPHQLAPRGQADFDLYPYTPSSAAGWTFLILFSISGVVHLVLSIPLRTWFFIPFILGCAGEAVGYYGRVWSSSNIRQGSPYLIQLMLILASAPLIAATIYMTLGRLIRSLDAEEHAVLSTRLTTKIYVLIDIGSFLCQMAGSAMQASGDSAGVKTGNTIVIAGLGIQLVAFAFFVLMTTIFQRRLNRDPTKVSLQRGRKWRRHFGVLYAVSTLVIVRSLFRLIEFIEGPEGKLYKTEAYLYAFDASLMFSVVVIMAAVHPGMLLRGIRKGGSAPLADSDSAGFLLRSSVGK